MNPYTISPNLVKISLDPQLMGQFAELNARLQWRILTGTLNSCEDAPYLYFRISLKPRPGVTTYAGFSTGAPFMLTRDHDAQKRAFFLRHWIRQVPADENSNAPFTALNHMSVAYNGEHLLVRVNIDRPLLAQDAFKSIPFATWMFQVVQVDALIKEIPGLRFAFAIERTVTPDEREFLTSSGLEYPSKGTKLKQAAAQTQTVPQGAPQVQHSQHSQQPQHLQPSQNSQHPQQPQPTPTVRPARPLAAQHIAHPVMAQNVAPRPNMAYPQLNQRPPAAALQPHPYAFASARASAVQLRPNVAPRPPYMNQPLVKPPQRNYTRAMSPAAQPGPPSIDTLRPVMHPYLRLWEDRDLDDPYEPIFVSEDPKYEERARRSWVIEESEDHAKRFQYQHLFGLPTADYPSFYYDGPDASAVDGEPDIELVVNRKQLAKPEMSELTSDSGDEDLAMKLDAAGKYSAAVIAAADYNSVLQNERADLRRWLVEDVSREEEESEEEEEEEEPDAESSD